MQIHAEGARQIGDGAVVTVSIPAAADEAFDSAEAGKNGILVEILEDIGAFFFQDTLCRFGQSCEGFAGDKAGGGDEDAVRLQNAVNLAESGCAASLLGIADAATVRDHIKAFVAEGDIAEIEDGIAEIGGMKRSVEKVLPLADNGGREIADCDRCIGIMLEDGRHEASAGTCANLEDSAAVG